MEGLHTEGLDAEGLDAEGLDAVAVLDAEGLDAEGFDAEGFDAEGLDAEEKEEDGGGRGGVHATVLRRAIGSDAGAAERPLVWCGAGLASSKDAKGENVN